jgi:hypothetical protein
MHSLYAMELAFCIDLVATMALAKLKVACSSPIAAWCDALLLFFTGVLA